MFLARAYFASVTATIFGDAFPHEIFDDLMIVDAWLYHLLAPPLAWFAVPAHRAQRRIKARLLDFMVPWHTNGGTEDVEDVSAHGNDVLRQLVRSRMSPLDQAGALEGYVWTTFTTVARLSFWLFAHLLADPCAYERVQEAVVREVETEWVREGRELLDASPAALGGDKFALLDSAIKEAARIHLLPMSYRNVLRDVEIPVVDRDGRKGTFWARQGDVVVANVRAMHWDARLFDDPGTFRVDRFLDKETDRSRYLSIFGRGKYTVSDSIAGGGFSALIRS